MLRVILSRPASRAGGFYGLLVTALAIFCALVLSALAPGADSRRITIIQLGDLHGKVDTHPEFFLEHGRPVFRPAGGLASIATLVRQIRGQQPGRTALFVVGDTWWTSGLTVLSNGKAIIPLINALKPDGMTPGNWDFFPNRQAYEERVKLVEFPVLASNLFDRTSGRARHPSYLIKEIGGVKVGVIGITSIKVHGEMNPTVGDGWQFTFPVKEQMRALVRDLKQNQRADLVLVLSEMGLAQDVQFAKDMEGSGLDFILGAETHERVYKPIVSGGIGVVQAGSEGSFIGRLDVTVAGGKVTGYRWQLIEVDAKRYPPDAEMQRLAEEVKAPYREQLDRVIGYTETPLYRNNVLETPMDNLILHALEEFTGADITLTRAFGYGHPVMPGPITMDDLYNMFPVNPRLRAGKVTGQQFVDWLEEKLEKVFSRDAYKQAGGWVDQAGGVVVRFKKEAPPSRRVQELLIRGRLVDPKAAYTVASCAREGEAEDMLCQLRVSEPRTLAVRAHEVIMQYLQKHSPVRVDFEDRILAVDLPKRIWTQFPQPAGDELRLLRDVLVGTAALHVLLAANGVMVPHATEDGSLAARAMYRGRFRLPFWLGVGGSLFPVVLWALGEVGAGGWPLAAGAALVGLLLYEHAYVQAGQSVPLR